MADPKQVQLNGAYYGPSIPPRRDHRSVGHRRSGCCCGSLLCCLLKPIISIAFTLGVIVLVLWLVFRPNKLNAHVETATLSQFNFTDKNSVLSYNLALDISLRNPNKRVAFYYDSVEARAIYDGARFDYEELPAFFQGHKNTTTLSPEFKGQQAALSSVTETFNREKGEGYFYVQVKLYTKLRVKVWFIKLGHFKPKIDCVVKLPVPSDAGSTAAASFERTKCDVDAF